MPPKLHPPQRDLGTAFFHDPHTHRAITQIAALDTVVIYAGLGVTIDRTQLNWHGLITGLLTDLKLSEAQQEALFAVSGGSDIAAASMAYELYSDSAGDDALKNMQKCMRNLLYPVRHLADAGQLVEALSYFMDGAAKLGKTVVVVTPNYEDELLKLLKAMTALPVDEFHVVEGTTTDLADEVLATPGMKYVYLHGSIPDAATMSRPVLHERDYFDTEQAVRGFLGRLFSNANSLFIGTSLVDPPLVASLLASSESGYLRWSLHPLQAPAWSTQTALRADQVKYHDLRLRHLGVLGLYPDYFGQTAQFLQEVRECRRVGAPYDETFSTRYGQRLCRWWEDWRPRLGTGAEQSEAHLALATFAENELPALLPFGENFKVELWLRWDPQNERSLAHWASSTGGWRSEVNMRKVPLEARSPWVAAEVFTQGRIWRQEVASDRWKVFAGAPLEYVEGDSPAVPIGTIVMASMTGAPSGALVDPGKAAALKAALLALRNAGQEVVATGRYVPL